MHDLDVFAGIVREEGFLPEMAQLVLDAMTLRRTKLFTDFAGMLETAPFDVIGERVRNVL